MPAKPRGFITKTLFLAGVLALMAVFWWINRTLDHLENGWAYARPPVLGSWQGELSTVRSRLKLVVSLSRDPVDYLPAGDSAGYNRGLSGLAVLCDSNGRVESYKLSGYVHDRRVRGITADLTPLPRETAGLRPTRLALRWNGSDAMDGQTTGTCCSGTRHMGFFF